jgi:nucleoid-associated protein YgaU
VGWISFDRGAGIDLATGAAGQATGGLTLAIEAHVLRLGLRAHGFEAMLDPATGVLRLHGCADSQDLRERIVLCCGNVQGVAAVDDRMTVLMPSEASRWRFVQPGETLARIAHDVYRNSARAAHLRAANQPLLDGSDEPSPGWLLRIPA